MVDLLYVHETAASDLRSATTQLPAPNSFSKLSCNFCGHRRGRTSAVTPLIGRVDSAQAEELLAGMGFNVEAEKLPKKRESTHHTVGDRSRKRRKRILPPSANENLGDAASEGEGGGMVEGAHRIHAGNVSEQTSAWGFLDKSGFELSAEDLLRFERNGHIVTRGVLTEREVKAIRPSILSGYDHQELEALKQKVAVWYGEEESANLNTTAVLRARLKRLDPENVPFLQVFNMFRKDVPSRDVIQRIVKSARLAQIASALLGCTRVRLYQDSTFCKRPGDGPTRWHSDLHMAPLDGNDMVTAWIPLTPIPSRREGGTPLVFASRSHRDMALHHWQDPKQMQNLVGRYAKRDHAPLALGDITWHHGWTLHSSPSNPTGEPRTALTVSYFRDGTRLLSDSAMRRPDAEDEWSYSSWLSDLTPGDIAKHADIPLVGQ